MLSIDAVRRTFLRLLIRVFIETVRILLSVTAFWDELNFRNDESKFYNDYVDWVSENHASFTRTIRISKVKIHQSVRNVLESIITDLSTPTNPDQI